MGINLAWLKGISDGITSAPAVNAAKAAFGEAMKAIDSEEGKKVVDATIELTLTVVKVGLETIIPATIRPFVSNYIEMGLGAAGTALETAVNAELDKLNADANPVVAAKK